MITKKESSYQKLKRLHAEERADLMKDIKALVDGGVEGAMVACTWKLRFDMEKVMWFGTTTKIEL